MDVPVWNVLKKFPATSMLIRQNKNILCIQHYQEEQ